MAVIAVLVLCLPLVAIAADRQHAETTSKQQETLTSAIRDRLINRTFVTKTPLVEEYKTPDIKVESQRVAQYSNLQAADGRLFFDLTLVLSSRKTSPGDEGPKVRTDNTISVTRYDLRYFAPLESYVGISQLLSSTSSSAVVGEARAVTIRWKDGGLVVDATEIHPRVDTNDGEVITSDTTIHVPAGGDELRVTYVEYTTDARTRQRGNKRFDEQLTYKEQKPLKESR